MPCEPESFIQNLLLCLDSDAWICRYHHGALVLQGFDREWRSIVGLLALILIHLHGCFGHCVYRTENLMCQEDEDGSTHGRCLINFIHMVRVEPGKMEKLEVEELWVLPVANDGRNPKTALGIGEVWVSCLTLVCRGPPALLSVSPCCLPLLVPCSLLLPVLPSLAAGLCISKHTIFVPLFSFLGEIGKGLKKGMLPV